MIKKFFFTFISALSVVPFLSEGLHSQEGNNIRPYGNLYVFFGYLHSSGYDSGQKEQSDQDTFYSIKDDSNLGFNFSYKKYMGVFELGISDIENERNVQIRKAFGEYNFDFGKLMIGQNYAPYVKWSHETANYYRSRGFGSFYEDPTVQLKLSTSFGLYFDIIKPYVPILKYGSSLEVDNPEQSSENTSGEYLIIEIEREKTTLLEQEKIQSLMPKMAAGFDYTGDLFEISTGGAVNMYFIRDDGEIIFNKSYIYSYMFYLDTVLTPGEFSFRVCGGYAVNPANFGVAVQSSGNSRYPGGAAQSIYNLATGKFEIKDTWNVQAFAEAGWEITKYLNAFIGYGFSVMDYPMVNTQKDYAMEYYANLKINLGALIALTPSFSYRDYMENMSLTDNKEGRDIYGGILATVSFY